MKDKNNLEHQLADKLGNRSIAPSAQAWDRIAQNREQGKDKKKKKRTYLYYAASIVLLLLVGGYFFVTVNNNVGSGPQVVTSKSIETTGKAEEAVDTPEFELPGQQVEIAVTHKVTEQQSDALNLHREEVKMIEESIRLPIKVSPSEISVAALQPAKVLSKDELYEDEADYLLKNAIKDVAAKKLLTNPTNDAALLKEVEGEMDEYYREKAMSIFSLKNKKIRFAVKD